MPRRTSLTSLKEMGSIDLTPVMDMAFMLIITFLITFPLIEQGIPVNLPRGDTEELKQEQTRTITLDLQGQLYLDDLKITPQELSMEMKALGQADPDIVVFVRADEGIQYGKLVEVLKILHDAKVARMALVTQPGKETKRRL